MPYFLACTHTSFEDEGGDQEVQLFWADNRKQALRRVRLERLDNWDMLHLFEFQESIGEVLCCLLEAADKIHDTRPEKCIYCADSEGGRPKKKRTEHNKDCPVTLVNLARTGVLPIWKLEDIRTPSVPSE